MTTELEQFLRNQQTRRDLVTGTPYEAERHTAEEFARMQDPEPLTPGHALDCICERCGLTWLKANLER